MCIHVESALVQDGVSQLVSFDDWLAMMQDLDTSVSFKLDSILSIESETWGTRLTLPVSWIKDHSVASV